MNSKVVMLEDFPALSLLGYLRKLSYMKDVKMMFEEKVEEVGRNCGMHMMSVTGDAGIKCR